MLVRKLGTAALAMGLMLSVCPSTWGQTTFGSITGSVLDSSGAAIPAATVTLTNLGTAEKRTQASGPDGLYSFVNLLPGQYRLETEKEGFKRFTREPVTVETGQAARIDATMQLGTVSQTVEVTAQTPLLSTQTSDLGQVIAEKQTNELPLNGRNAIEPGGLGAERRTPRPVAGYPGGTEPLRL